MKTRIIQVVVIATIFLGSSIFIIGMNSYFEIHATEQRLADIARSGSSVPTISYHNLWVYFGTSAIFFAISGSLFVWRKRK